MSDSMRADESRPSYGRIELERDLVEWLEEQHFDQEEMDRVLEKLHALDKRSLSDHFFATLGADGVDMGQFVNELLSDQPVFDQQPHQTSNPPADSRQQPVPRPQPVSPREAEFQLRDIAARWEELDRETRELIRQLVMQPPAEHVRKTIRSLLGLH